MISIIGMGCIYPDAFSPIELWNNILSKRISFRKIPNSRIDLSYYDGESSDSIYIKNAALIKNYTFDRKKFQISNSVFTSADLTHWLALDVAYRTLTDSGLINENILDKEKTAVIVGNTLTGEFSRSELMRLRWPYVKRLLESKLSKLDIDVSSFIEDFEISYKQPFNVPNEDSLSGGLSNTIAGRISNYFNFNGGCFTVDGACSSSLVAVTQACNLLENNSIKYALVGGVDLSLDPFELIGFSRISAMSRKNMKVYDKNSDGFLPGEGCGFVLLTKTENAISNGIKKYCDIIGWGISSDGSGGLTRPEINGQKLAVQRACEKANVSPCDITLFEGHGTGTPIGDYTELAALNQLLYNSKNKHFIGSVKTNIGHTKAAAGVAGLIKSIMSLQTQIIPRITSHIDSHEEIIKKDSKLSVLKNNISWPKNRPLIAGVSSFGFGGINSHIVLQNPTTNSIFCLDKSYHQKNKTYQDCELILIDGDSKDIILEKIENILNKSKSISISELSDISVRLIEEINYSNKHRLSVVCESPLDLIDKLNKTKIELLNNSSFIFDKSGIYYCENQNYKTCYVFPGQAAPVRFNQGIFDSWNIEGIQPDKGDTTNTSVAQPCIINSEYCCYSLLQKFNIQPNYVIGHSLGELMSMYSVGILDKQTLFALTKSRGKIMQNLSQEGTMIVVFCDDLTIKNILKQHESIDVAGYNSSNQIVLSGISDDMLLLCDYLKKENISFVTLPITRMFHSRHMKFAAEEWRELLISTCFNKYNKNTSHNYISTITGGSIEEDSIVDLLTKQFTEPVLFTKALSSIDKNNTLFIEVGPGNILCNLISSDNGLCVSTDFGSRSTFGVLSVIGSYFTMVNNNIDLFQLTDRFTKPIDILSIDSFFTNPCEINIKQEKTNESFTIGIKTSENSDALSIIKRCVAIKTELSIDSIKDTDNFLKDLHLNSINVGQIIAESCKLLNIEVATSLSEFSNKTIKECATFLETISNRPSDNNEIINSTNVEGIETWTQSYSIVLEQQNLLDINDYTINKNNSKWNTICSDNYQLNKEAETISKSLRGNGTILCLDKKIDIEFLLSNTKKIIEDKVEHLVVVQHNSLYTSFFRTLQQETDIKILVINLPDKEYDASLVIKEFYNNKKNFNYIVYDNNIRKIESFKINTTDKYCQKIYENDVILVSGGAKGITYECAKKLAQETNCILAIVGRSNKEDIAYNLEALDKFNIRYAYYVADVCDENQVRSAIKNINNDYGKITGIIHGAGLNKPCLINSLTVEDFYKTYNPKVVGLNNIINNVDINNLKILVNFSSIIGRLGMSGQADYALSNAITSDMVADFKIKHPSIHCLSLEWSVWSDVGMGANLGKIESLINQGIIPISIKDGVREFLSLINNEDQLCVVPVIGRLGNICEFNNYNNKELPFLRFLEIIRVYYPSLELIADFELSETNDLYLVDHEFKGEKVFPAVMMMEAAVQSYKTLTSNNDIPQFKNIQFNQPIVVNKPITVRICCLKTKEHTKIVLRCSDTMFKIDHFYCEISSQDNFEVLEDIKIPENFNISTEYMYNNLLFQKHRFANIDHYYKLSAYQSYASISEKITDSYFNRSFPQTMTIGNPGARDSCLHSIQCCIPDKLLLPFKIESIQILDIDSGTSKVAYSHKVWEKNNEYCYNLIVCDINGKILEIWNNIILKSLEDVDYKEWNKHLLGCYIQRCLSEKSDVEILFDIPVNDIIYRADGKPEHNNKYISKSHCNNLTMITTSRHPVGCDIESIKTYHDKLLNHTNKNLYKLLQQSYSESNNVTQTRVWTIIEAVKKSGLNLNEPITLDTITDKFIKLKISNYKIYSFSEKIDDNQYCITILTHEQ